MSLKTCFIYRSSLHLFPPNPPTLELFGFLVCCFCCFYVYEKPSYMSCRVCYGMNFGIASPWCPFYVLLRPCDSCELISRVEVWKDYFISSGMHFHQKGCNVWLSHFVCVYNATAFDDYCRDPLIPSVIN